MTYTADDDGYHANVQYRGDPQQKKDHQTLYSHYNPSQHQYQPTHDYKYKYSLASPYQDNATNEMRKSPKKEMPVTGVKPKKDDRHRSAPARYIASLQSKASSSFGK